MNVLLLSTYELGHQPLNLARPAAHLADSGHVVAALDLAVQPLDEAAVRAADLIGVSVPMHTAARLGAALADRLRALNPRAHLCFYGLYAPQLAHLLDDGRADSLIGGEFETPLVALVADLDRAHPLPPWERVRVRAAGVPARRGYPSGPHPDPQAGTPLPGVEEVITATADGGTFLGRQAFQLPRRNLLPPLGRYTRVETAAGTRLAGYVEASRGCVHHCRHCPIPPVYGGRLRVVPAEVVLEDIRQLVASGAGHITFGDPDFFNGVRHSLRILAAMHAAFPDLSFDATIKIGQPLSRKA